MMKMHLSCFIQNFSKQIGFENKSSTMAEKEESVSPSSFLPKEELDIEEDCC